MDENAISYFCLSFKVLVAFTRRIHIAPKIILGRYTLYLTKMDDEVTSVVK